ncbi:MAG TPA: hydantoinase/oxoprolinase family protein [Stellaceae bacterium]|nr:hydantoinase/oxoprolinase family protein [Stellaceae bacterium]
MSSPVAPYSVAVDIGGTFTDLVAYDHASGRVTATKSPTSYGDFSHAILDCFRKGGFSPAEARLINHGTTLVINALLERKGAKTALVTTKGFRDVLEIARANRPDPFDLRYRRDEPLIPRDLRFELDERMDHQGEIVRPVDAAALKTLAAEFMARQVQAVAVFFLNSYLNPASERLAAEHLRALLPGVYVTCSVDLTREWYEYERSSTVAANAFVGPQVADYVGRLEQTLQGDGFAGKLFLMGSNGGLMSAERACARPVVLVESGPVGGSIGAAVYADALDLPNVIAFDMGGTTAKCAQIANGRFAVESTYYVGGYVKGFPIRASVLDIVEVGSGGGSIAAIDTHGRLSVGPQSAGSTPGPACYGRGGTDPTITDANLLLGRLDPDGFLGGELRLDVDASRRAVARVAETLGYKGVEGGTRMAEGILAIASVVMADAIRQVSVKQGLDPRDFVLFCYGGGGPLHGSALAHELGIPTLIIPPEPGNFSALGMLLCDARLDLSETFVAALGDDAERRLTSAFADLEANARETLAKDFPAGQVVFERHAEMRFTGQRHNMKIALPARLDAAVLADAFRAEYRQRYGHADPGAAIELQVLHVSAFVRSAKPDLVKLSAYDGSAAEPTLRRVHFGLQHGWLDARAFRRRSLPPGFTASGPALIEEYGSTTLIWPGDRFTIGRLGEIRIDCRRDEIHPGRD